MSDNVMRRRHDQQQCRDRDRGGYHEKNYTSDHLISSLTPQMRQYCATLSDARGFPSGVTSTRTSLILGCLGQYAGSGFFPNSHLNIIFAFPAGHTGFEPATSTLTGWRALQAALQLHDLTLTPPDSNWDLAN